MHIYFFPYVKMQKKSRGAQLGCLCDFVINIEFNTFPSADRSENAGEMKNKSFESMEILEVPESPTIYFERYSGGIVVTIAP